MAEESITILEDVKYRFNALGYGSSLLFKDYEFADVFSPELELPVKQIPLAIFYQYPPSYLSACFGVCIANGIHGEQLVSKYRALGAPQVFEISPKGLTRWQITRDARPQFIDFVESQNIRNLFDRNKDAWSPDRIKSLRDFSHQLEFTDIGLLPLLDREVQIHFDRLLTRTIKQSISKHPDIVNEYRQLFRLIFRLVTAKIMADRKHEGHWLHNDPRLVIKEVEDYYFKNVTPEPVLDDRDVQIDIWREIRDSFHFHNLSVEALAYVYEHTLMTPEFRKQTGTHGTPPAIAEYVVKRLPFQDIPENERYVFEPFGGHDIFLVAALRRLRDLLPASITPEQRHEYFKSMLSSLEIEDFAREVARIMLNNADYPNPNGWRLNQGDVFQSDILESELSKANIVLCNPPFEDFTDKEKACYKRLTSPHKPAEILNRVLTKPPKMLGFVLPRIFISGKGYSSIRHTLSEKYSDIEVLALPDNVFRYSEADTVLLIASGQPCSTIHLSVGQVYEKDLEPFYSTYKPSYTNDKDIPGGSKGFTDQIWLLELADIWEALSNCNKLCSLADIHRGVEWQFSVKEHSERAVSDHKQPGFAKGLHRVSDSLEPFVIRSHKYLNISSEDMRGYAYKEAWDKPKIVINAWRRTRGHWRITAAVDNDGLYCSQSFDGIWVQEGVPLEIIAAILNSPLANAYVSDHEMTAKENRVETLRSIPIPNITDIAENQMDRIVELVSAYKHARQSWLDGILVDDSARIDCDKLLRQIDGEVLQMYNLPQRLVKRLLDYFSGHRRSLPKEFLPFNGYYPTSFRQHMRELQERINTADLRQEGSPEERANHKAEVMRSLEGARKRANTTRLLKG